MNVLLASDGLDGARSAAELLAYLPFTEEDRILTLRVGEEPDPEAQRAGPPEALSATAARVDRIHKSGNPAETILITAAHEKADLIVLGAVASGDRAGHLLGAVAERVVRHSECPVLVARPLRRCLKEVLLAVDRSRISEDVAKLAAWLPLPAESEIRLMTVVPPREALISVAPTAWSGLARELAHVMDAAVAGAEEHLRDLGRLLRHTRRSVAAEVRRGAPAEQIIAAVEQHGADLIIMGSHGEGDVDRWLLGSVSERIARYAGCSVLVVH